ncbi:MAG: DUF2808 domain-containing protein [Gloeocapsa sp. DLM2.Bin57]|nr:MAG: DUF2808 domain-containing protein [Gloeocapsa sp. DLM2.Bin57]
MKRIILSSLAIFLLTSQPIKAQPSNAFTGTPPTFVGATVPHNSVGFRLSWYYFTTNLPVDSQQSLGKLTITPGSNFSTIDFNLNETQAFLGSFRNRGEAINIQQVNLDPDNQTIEIIFAEPIPPDTVFTVGLRARQNPTSEGVYLFRIYAFPAGDNPIGLDLGVARLSFYQSFW